MRISSSLSRKPTAVIDGAFSQSPEWSAQAERRRARSVGVRPCYEIWKADAMAPSHTFSMARSSSDGSSVWDSLVQDENASVLSTSSRSRMDTGIIAFWSWSVNIAEAKKALVPAFLHSWFQAFHFWRKGMSVTIDHCWCQHWGSLLIRFLVSHQSQIIIILIFFIFF